ncbi:ferric reductase like transmembrane component-domain-containing protein [Mycena vulgaris]|nr:ferric reductase like transmembrane component-domain-containing protein [Mycena vulgaris]
MSHGTPPVIPEALLPYNTYIEDPKWQVRFTIIWGSLLGVCVVCAAPRVINGLRSGTALAGLAGVRVAELYAPLPSDDDADALSQTTAVGSARSVSGPSAGPARNWVHTTASLLSSFTLWNIPGISLNLGQMCVVAAYSVLTLISMIRNAPLMSNPNRPGFLALTQLPLVFLFAMKNSPVALLLGPGVDYTKLNYVHRWAGRGLVLGAALHGALWIQNHLTWNLPILSRQKESSGVAALACLCVIVLTSVAPLRRWSYSAFITAHYLTFPAFFITICYHTPFATPWILPPLAFYAVDTLLRLLKLRIVVGRVCACPGGMSIVTVPAANAGWRAGQHVQLRALVGARAFAQAHPITILCAPPDTTCLAPPPGLLLAARACGPWSRALHNFGRGTPPTPLFAGSLPAADAEGGGAEEELADECEKSGEGEGRAAHVILDGPYGGPTLDAGAYADVLFLAGGSGVTATLGQLDDLVGRCVRRGRTHGERTRHVEWVWCVKHEDALGWFAPQLAQIAAMAARPKSGLTLRIRIFVTGTKTVPDCCGCEVRTGRPTVRALIDELLLVASDSASSEEKVLAVGPACLLRDAGNAVARVNMSRRVGVEFCAEAFAI